MQVSNPKTAVVCARVFASMLPHETPSLALAAIPIPVVAIETIWCSVVVLALSSPLPRARYLASKVWIDRITRAIMSLLGLKLIIEAQQP